jgi:DNA polymerase III epsilon subunit-like protein
MKYKLVFFDTEFTGLHAGTTLVSFGLISTAGEELYVTLNDYDKIQVSSWLEENVLIHIDPVSTVDSRTAFSRLNKWLEEIAGGECISLVSAGLSADLVLLFDLYRYQYAEGTYFNAVNQLPDFLKHPYHFDLNTLFTTVGLDPSMDRELFTGKKINGSRHDAMYDARMVRECFLKMRNDHRLKAFESFI